MSSSYGAMRVLEADQLVTADDYNNLVTNIEKMAQQLCGPNSTARKDLDDGVTENLAPADYDSGIFTGSDGNTYTKAHSLGVIPRAVLVEFTASATPADSDYRVAVYSEHASGSDATEVAFNDTNVKVHVVQVVSKELGLLSTMYFRIWAWK